MNYEKLENSLTEMLRDRNSLEKRLHRSMSQGDEMWMASLLKNGYSQGVETRERQERMKDSLNLTGYRVYLLSVDNQESVVAESLEEEYETVALMHFSIKNVLEESLNLRERKGMLLEIDDMVVAIVPETEEQKEEHRIILQECIDFFENTFTVHLVAAVSERHGQWMELSAAYEEAFRIMTYKNFWGEELEDVLVFQETPEESNRKRSSNLLDQEKRLSNCLLTRNYEEASQVLDEILETAFRKEFRYLSYNQCQASALIGVMLDSLEETVVSGETDDREIISRRLMETKSLPDLKWELHSILDEIVESRKAVCGNEPEWLYEVKCYIEENYWDYNLNISHIADQFGMSTSHLGSRFKSLTGISMLDYIHMIRLQAAKKMLLSGMTIKSCAEEAGYSDAKTFNRAFKRYEGITPGQYRENAEIL